MILCDFHIHSDNSFDAKNSVDELCEAALRRGLSAIAVTDHCETPFIPLGENCEFGSFDKRIPKSIADAENAKKKYSGRLRVMTGIELGEPMHDSECTQRALSYGEYDFILASVHNLRGMEDFYYLDYSKLDINELLHKYFDELAETAAFEHFDSLAHLTYPLRYIVASTGKEFDLSPFEKQIDNIFKILIKNKKALEINVSGLFKELKTTLPDERLVRRFKELGGEYVTIGTDAHSTEAVGVGIEKGINTAKNAGFEHYTIYEARKPCMIEI